MFNRVATFPQYNTLQVQNLRLQGEFARVSEQISSGLKSNTFGGVADDAQLIAQFEADIARSQDYIDNIQIASDRVDVMYASVQSVIGTLVEFKTDLTAALDGTQVSATELQLIVQNYYADVEGTVNTQMAGRFLFSGAATATAPIDVNDALYPAFVVPSAADTNYYQGDTTLHNVVVSEGRRVTYGVTADNTGFEQALRAMNLIINNPGNNAAIQEALGLVDNAETQLANVLTGLSTDAVTLLERQNEHITNQTYTEGFLAQLKEVDLADATSRLSQVETQLQASYSATSRILNLTILDYLRR